MPRSANAIKNSFCELNPVAVESGRSKVEATCPRMARHTMAQKGQKKKEKKIEFAYEISRAVRANRTAVLIRQLCTVAELWFQNMQNFALALRCV